MDDHDGSDELARIDADRIQLLQAAAKAGHVCHECKSVLSNDDQRWLLVVVGDYLKHREKIRAAVRGFAEALLNEHRQTNGQV